MKRTHIILRPDHALCTKCFKTEPVTVGHGTPMDTFIAALDLISGRHQNCRPQMGLKKCELRHDHKGECKP